MKWYPADWRADPGLRMCSLAARGLWADMLALMHEAEPYGHLLVNGIAPSNRQLAGLLGCEEKEIARCMQQLEECGVFSRSEDGTVISRRMLRDFYKRERDKANGKTGGNPRLKAGVGEGVNPQSNPTVGEEDKAQKPEARSQKPEEEIHRNGRERYAFECGVVRLTKADLDRWNAAFSHVAVPAVLTAAEPWLRKQKNWFNAAAGMLAKREQEAISGAGKQARKTYRDAFGNEVEDAPRDPMGNLI